MLIDWFTVGVQIVNFLILIALLKRFLYGPLLRVMDERQQAIDQSLAEAAQTRLEAAGQLAALAEEKEALLSARQALLRQAAAEVESWREAALARIRQELDGKRLRWQRQLAEEQAAFFEKLQQEIGVQVLRLAAKVLADLADERLEARLVGVFLARLAAIQDPEAGRLPAASELVLRSGFALRPEARQDLQNGLLGHFGAEKRLIFQEEAALGFGLRLTAGDQAWDWNLAHYLEGLEQDLRQVMVFGQNPGEGDG